MFTSKNVLISPTLLRQYQMMSNKKNKLIIGNLNINYLSPKFDQLKVLIQEKIDILIIT